MHEMKQIVYKRWKNRKHSADRLDQFKNLAGEKAVRMVQHWGISFQSRKDVPWFWETFRRLQEKGVRFPPADDDTRTPIDTPAKTPDVLRNSAIASSKRSGAAAQTPNDVSSAIKDTNSSMQLLEEMAGQGATPDLLHDIVEELRKNLKILRRLVDPNLDSEKTLSLILTNIDKAEELLKRSGYADSVRGDQAANPDDDAEASDEMNDSDLLSKLEGSSCSRSLSRRHP
jgi:hypothetical protein